MQNPFVRCIRETQFVQEQMGSSQSEDIWCEHWADDKQEFMHTSGVDVSKDLLTKT